MSLPRFQKNDIRKNSRKAWKKQMKLDAIRAKVLNEFVAQKALDLPKPLQWVARKFKWSGPILIPYEIFQFADGMHIVKVTIFGKKSVVRIDDRGRIVTAPGHEVAVGIS